VKRIVDLFLSGTEQYEASNLAHLSAKCWDTGGAPGGDRWVSCGFGTWLKRICEQHNLPIRLNTLVTHIDTNDNTRIAITTSDNSSVLLCRRVIITIPLGCLKRNTIIFEPPLPEWKREAIDRMGYGLMNKLIVQFPDCFWGYSTRSIVHACNERRGRFRFTICLPPPANILILFVTGTFAKELEILTDDETLVQIMSFLQQIFPQRTIPDPIRYKFSRWSQDPLAYGSYSNFAVHSSPHTIALLAKETADGRVHWAGEHANADDGSESWAYACVHTAFQSGQRAAKTIRNQLSDL
jgi:lysine-specific histone demethylase 1